MNVLLCIPYADQDHSNASLTAARLSRSASSLKPEGRSIGICAGGEKRGLATGVMTGSDVPPRESTSTLDALGQIEDTLDLLYCRSRP